MSDRSPIYEKYGKYYDIIYSKKNYEAECECIIEYFKRFSEIEIHRVLDVGCGTGGHSILLAKRGYMMVGVDSSTSMIRQARKKAESEQLPVEFYTQDKRRLELGDRRFDAAICLFGTIGYCITDNELSSTLSNVWRHLVSGGLFIFDFFPVQIHVKRSSWRSVFEAEKGKTRIIRIMEGEFELETNIINLRIKCYVIEGRKVREIFEEGHKLRAFTIPEMRHFLRENAFIPLGFFKVDWSSIRPYSLKSVDVDTANIACVAKKDDRSILE